MGRNFKQINSWLARGFSYTRTALYYCKTGYRKWQTNPPQESKQASPALILWNHLLKNNNRSYKTPIQQSLNNVFLVLSSPSTTYFQLHSISCTVLTQKVFRRLQSVWHNFNHSILRFFFFFCLQHSKTFPCEVQNTVNVTRFEADNPHWQSSLTFGLGTQVVIKRYGRSHVPPKK